MKQYCLTFILIGALGVLMPAMAQDPISVAREASTKVIKAIDLEVQRLQNQTIWLQDAQKELENVLSQLKLQDIANWVQQQKDLYGKYFDELSQVKSILTEYHRVKELMARQAAILTDYKKAMGLFNQDSHFSPSELQHMEAVYAGILAESLQNLDQVTGVLQALVTKMTDEQRLHVINTAADQVDHNYSDLQAFTHQNQILSLQRAKDQEEINQIKKLYDL